MWREHRRLPRAAATILLLVACGGCSHRALQQHRQKLSGLQSTAALVADHWLDRRLTARAAATVLDQTVLLVEAERASLASLLASNPSTEVVNACDWAGALAAAVASMRKSVRADDAASVRRLRNGLSSSSGGSPPHDVTERTP